MANLLKINTFDFDDVALVPKECAVLSRSEISVKAELSNYEFNLPVIPANMSTVVDTGLAELLTRNNYFYVMHRFNIDPIEFTKSRHKIGHISSISLGIQDADHEIVDKFYHQGITPEFITVDVAHGDNPQVFKIVERIKEKLPKAFVIAGNVSRASSVLSLEDAGADASKVGVGPGLACSTFPNTGFGTKNWQLSAIQECADAAKYSKIIADGGIRTTGDIAKAIAFGADFVMVGGMLSAHEESPGNVVIDESGVKYKEFFGSASEFQKGEKKHVEGKRMLNPLKGSIFDTLTMIKENLQSAVSYAGGTSLYDLRQADFVRLK